MAQIQQGLEQRTLYLIRMTRTEGRFLTKPDGMGPAITLPLGSYRVINTKLRAKCLPECLIEAPSIMLKIRGL